MPKNLDAEVDGAAFQREAVRKNIFKTLGTYFLL